VQFEATDLGGRGTCAGQAGIDGVEVRRDFDGEQAVGGCEEDSPAVVAEDLYGLRKEIADRG